MNSRDDPWAPYEPSAADPWDLGKVAHLHRRAGFGVGRSVLDRDLRAGPAASVGRLLAPPEVSAEERLVLDGLGRSATAAHDRQIERLKAAWLYRMLFGPDPLRERLTLFWHGHFATSNRKVASVDKMRRQNETLRRHALGPFGTLLGSIVADPAMLAWLDGAGSTAERPNENFAREFLELFSLGVGHYSEADVRAAARAFAGYDQDGRFDPARSDDGPKTFLGRTGPWGAADIVRITLDRPETAEFLCRKLYRAFVRDDEDPTPELIGPLAEAFRKAEHSIAHVVGLVLRSRHFYSTEARRAKIKGPVDFCVGLLRELEIPPGRLDMIRLQEACDLQGQGLYHPPNVKGWDGGRAWITSLSLLARTNWVAEVIWGDPGLEIPPYEPPPGASVESFMELLLQGDVTPDERTLVVAAARDDPRRALQLLLHLPAYQLS